MEEKYNILGPKSTLEDLVIIAARELIENELNAFDFDIHGIDPNGNPIILHFEATIQQCGNG